MLRPCAILGVLFAVATFACPALASGDSPVDSANRYERPQVVIKRILESDRPDAAKGVALRRFAQVGDLECLLDRKLGKPKKVFNLTPTNGRNELYFYESGLAVRCIEMKVIAIYRPTSTGFVSISTR